MPSYLLTRIGAMSRFQHCRATGWNVSRLTEQLREPEGGQRGIETHAVRGIAVDDERPSLGAGALPSYDAVGAAHAVVD